MAKAQFKIGQRAYEEVLRLFDRMDEARRAIGTTNKNHLYEWMRGVAPSAKHLQRLHYLGADVIYILTGVRK